MSTSCPLLHQRITSPKTGLQFSSPTVFSSISLCSATQEKAAAATQIITRASLTPLEHKQPHNVSSTFNRATQIGSGTFKEVRKRGNHPCRHPYSSVKDAWPQKDICIYIYILRSIIL